LPRDLTLSALTRQRKLRFRERGKRCLREKRLGLDSSRFGVGAVRQDKGFRSQDRADFDKGDRTASNRNRRPDRMGSGIGRAGGEGGRLRRVGDNGQDRAGGGVEIGVYQDVAAARILARHGSQVNSSFALTGIV
jgi:hypothetical protein